jgi:hypothetical protein
VTPAPRASLAALGLLLPLLKPYLPRVFAAIAALLLAAGLTLALGQGLKHLIDDGFAGGLGALDSAALVMGALITALAAATTTRFYLVSWLGERVAADLRQRFFDHVTGLSPAYFETARIGARERVKTMIASFGRIPAAVLLGLDSSAEDDIDQRWSHHDSEPDHDHDDFESFIVTLPAASSPEHLATRVQRALGAEGVLRIKGIAAVADRGARLVVQGVGERLETYSDRPWHENEERATRLVVIGLNGLDRARITGLIAD